MNLPSECTSPVAGILGGGGTISRALSKPVLSRAGAVCCSATGNWGAGATTGAGPILMSSTFLRLAISIPGGGPMMAGCGIERLRELLAPTFGAGAITAPGKNGAACNVLLLTVGGGVIGTAGDAGRRKSDARAGTTGAAIVGMERCQETIFGSATSLSNFRAGAVTIVCW